MTNITPFGNETYFNEDSKFFKDVYVYGTLYYDFPKSEDGNQFFSDLNLDSLTVGILTVTKRIDVGPDGSIFTVIASPTYSSQYGNVGIGSSLPQQKLDVSGSIKIDETIFDSVNVPGQNGYFLTRDEGGVRWIPLVAEKVTGHSGIGTVGIATYITEPDGVFVLNEMTPLYPS